MRLTVSKSGDLSGVASDIARAITKGQQDAGRAVAKEARRAILDDVKGRRGNLKMMGGRLGVKARVDATLTSSTVFLDAVPKGPWTIVTKGTRAYTIRPRRAEVLAAGRGDVIGMRADRKRRPGRDYWTMATDRLDDELDAVVARAVDAQMGNV